MRRAFALEEGRSHQLAVGVLQPPDYFWRTGGHIRGCTGKLLDEIRWLLDG